MKHLNGTTAATSDYPLRVGERLTVDAPLLRLSLICATGETASVRVLGMTGRAGLGVTGAAGVDIVESGITELVGINETVAVNQLSASVAVALPGTQSGEFLGFTLVFTEDGTGGIFEPNGVLYILDADPATSAGDTDFTAGEYPTIICAISVATSDWLNPSGSAIGSAAYRSFACPFHALANVYLVWLHELATSINSLAADDEQLEVNIFWRRDS